MKVRNITDGARDVPMLGTVVQPGEVVEVPETQPDGSPIAWPAATWELVPGAEAAAGAGPAVMNDGE